ncbi:MAG: TonB-dependent receptor [Chthoniobacterales bacterium]|nr:TonB-dependent receptor [Chthoniobacterales bacterium]
MRSPELFAALLLAIGASLGNVNAQDAISSPTPAPVADEIVVSATRVPTPQEETGASISVITSDDLAGKQTERVSDALREIPGLSVVQSGTQGQLTSVFTRGLKSEHTQVLIDGIPINQGLAGLFNFADLTVDDIDHIEVVRGPQSTLYGPRGLAGVIQIFTKQGSGPPSGSVSAEGGSYDTFRETFQTSGSWQQFDYSLGASRLDTDNARPNNEYRNTSAVANLGWSPNEQFRLSGLFTYSNSDASSPNIISDPKPLDNLLTERWLIAPHLDYKPFDWWEHKLIVSYDHERQVNDPNEDGFLPGTTFVGATRALFERFTVDYQNDLRPTNWLTLTSGFFYSDVDAGQERPFVSQAFGPLPTFISDHTAEVAGFVQASAKPFEGLNLVAGGRDDHFNQFGDVWTYRVAGSYRIKPTDTVLHSSYATGFSPPTSQDKIFGNNFNLDPERVRGFDVGVTQNLWNSRVVLDATYFHNRLSNVIGYNGAFDLVNLGAARTQGLEFEAHARPLEDLTLTASYSYLEAEKTSATDISQPPGSRLPRRPRNEVYVSASYLWCKKLRTTAEAKWVNAREEINFGFPNFDIEDYSFANFAAEYQVNSCLTIFGRIDNLTNEHYSEVFGFPALGRAAYGGVRVSF